MSEAENPAKKRLQSAIGSMARCAPRSRFDLIDALAKTHRALARGPNATRSNESSSFITGRAFAELAPHDVDAPVGARAQAHRRARRCPRADAHARDAAMRTT
ncbi:hypothetical protein PRJ39_22265 [Lysobacter enzymogenes]|uniref:hypothetical protein n=1 Tax=Lysobacter enzymogenes TaxID=69 RepID=UPI00374899ED